jgi:hypothetical protein
MPAAMRGFGRPAARAAAFSFGAACVSTVFAPVIHSTVPSASSPVSFSIASPIAATSSAGGGVATPMPPATR